MLLFLRKIFKPKNFEYSDLVSWDLKQKKVQKLVEEFGSGPFHIMRTFPQEGCSCGAGPGERHLGQNCIPKKIKTGHDFTFNLFDKSGKALRRHGHLMKFSGHLLKLQ